LPYAASRLASLFVRLLPFVIGFHLRLLIRHQSCRGLDVVVFLFKNKRNCSLLCCRRRGEEMTHAFIALRRPNENTSYQITCGNNKAEMVWKKFICPGINAKCVKVSEILLFDH